MFHTSHTSCFVLGQYRKIVASTSLNVRSFCCTARSVGAHALGSGDTWWIQEKIFCFRIKIIFPSYHAGIRFAEQIHRSMIQSQLTFKTFPSERRRNVVRGTPACFGRIFTNHLRISITLLAHVAFGIKIQMPWNHRMYYQIQQTFYPSLISLHRSQ